VTSGNLFLLPTKINFCSAPNDRHPSVTFPLRMSASTSYLSSSHHFDAFASILRNFDAEASARAAEGGGEDQVALLLDDEAGIALRFADVLEGM
jgi:hypothetical protein